MHMRTVALIAGLLWAPAPAIAEEAERPLSPAQTALFASDHLHAISTPTILRYSFAAAGGPADFTDSVTLGIEPRPDGTKDVRLDFLSGERHLPFQAVNGFRGNPVLMFFLERDVLEMHKATGGSALYFRNRIREAFLDRATTRPVSVAVEGKEQSGTEVTLAPFRNDPMIARFESFREKSYRFILVDAVPGTIYQIATLMPASGASDTLTFARAEPCKDSRACTP